MSEESSSLIIVEEDDFVEGKAEIVSAVGKAGIRQAEKVCSKNMAKGDVENDESSAKAINKTSENEENFGKVKKQTANVQIEWAITREADYVQKNADEKSRIDDEVGDVVMIDECGDGDEQITPVSQESPEKPKIYKRKVVRIPKEVFDYMAKIEDDGVVRFNITQFSVFFTNELTRKSVHVDATTWETTDEVPVLDISVPPTAKLDPTLIVNNFDNDPVHRQEQETRLKSILGHRQLQAPQNAVSNNSKLQTLHTGVSKILPAEEQMYKRLAKGQRWRDKIGGKEKDSEEKNESDEEKTRERSERKPLTILELRQKRLAEHSASSVVAQERCIAAKQPRLDINSSTSPKPARGQTPKSDDGLSLDTGGSDPNKSLHEKVPSKLFSNATSHFGVVLKGEKHKKHTSSHRQSLSPAAALNPSWNATESRCAAMHYQNSRLNKQQRYGSTRRTQEQLHYGEIHLTNREVSVEVSPWSRPPVQSLDLHKLEEVMRKAVKSNASSIDAARQVEKLGLGSAMGAVLNAVNHSDLPLSSRSHSFNSSPSLPVRSIAPLFHSSLNSIRTDSFGTSELNGRGFNSRVINNIDHIATRTGESTFAKPLREFNKSSTKFSRIERISYPLMPSSGEIHAEPTTPPFGQSYSAFNTQTYGQNLQYERVRGSFPRRRSPYNNRRCYR